jgi:hypothetical protein
MYSMLNFLTVTVLVSIFINCIYISTTATGKNPIYSKYKYYYTYYVWLS